MARRAPGLGLALLVTPLLALAACASLNKPRAGSIFPAPSNPVAEIQFERIKSLEGPWAWAPELGPAISGLVVTYEVTSAGTAVIERLFPGDEYEMITVYHLDGDQLLLTHYGSSGNQPTMRAQPGSPDGPIHFEYVSATNLASGAESHMRRVDFLELTPESLMTSWTFYEDRVSAGDRIFKLVRYVPGDEPAWLPDALGDLGAEGTGAEGTVTELPMAELEPYEASPEGELLDAEIEAELELLEGELELLPVEEGTELEDLPIEEPVEGGPIPVEPDGSEQPVESEGAPAQLR